MSAKQNTRPLWWGIAIVVFAAILLSVVLANDRNERANQEARQELDAKLDAFRQQSDAIVAESLR